MFADDLPYDILDIKNDIRKLKGRKLELISERKEIQNEIDVCETKRNALRQELNILGPLEDLQFDNGEILADTVGTDPATDQRHAEMDRKLELQILNSDIRAALVSLEADAIRCELHTSQLESAANASSHHFDTSSLSFLLKSRDEIENDISNGILSHQKLKQSFSRDVELRRREKSQLSADIGRLSEELSAVVDEIDVVRDTVAKAVRAADSTQARIDMLTKMENEMRGLIEQFWAVVVRVLMSFWLVSD